MRVIREDLNKYFIENPASNSNLSSVFIESKI
jgi:hypothetical protein